MFLWILNRAAPQPAADAEGQPWRTAGRFAFTQRTRPSSSGATHRRFPSRGAAVCAQPCQAHAVCKQVAAAGKTRTRPETQLRSLSFKPVPRQTPRTRDPGCPCTVPEANSLSCYVGHIPSSLATPAVFCAFTARAFTCFPAGLSLPGLQPPCGGSASAPAHRCLPGTGRCREGVSRPRGLGRSVSQSE